MNKTDLRIAAGITTTALDKLGKNENVNTEVLAKICKVLECGVDDIMEFIPDNKKIFLIQIKNPGYKQEG